ncbi:hypothetical protein BDY21DRAFT_290284, partial [Lineolata rhizophorae]
MPVPEGYHAPQFQPFAAVVPARPDQHHQFGVQAYPDFDDAGKHVVPPPGSSAKARRRPVAGSDPVKHRRTRSGCYTCRQRRVKCDETHPVCERCRKGNRECSYPESATSATPSSAKPRAGSLSSSAGDAKSKSPRDAGSGSSPEYEHDAREPLATIPDDDEEEEFAGEAAEAGGPPAAAATAASQQGGGGRRPATAARAHSDLPRKAAFYLDYYRTELSHLHHAFKYDGTDFMRTRFLDLARQNEPLLYAVVAFAAYHHTVSRPDGDIGHFLGYYNRSVSALRDYLSRNHRHTDSTLLCILMLASFEEFLGDWVNLMSHQKAACEIITELYTPETIMQNETRRKIIQWYMRYDIFAGLMAGYETVLTRDWFTACADYYEAQALEHPDDLGLKFEERLALSRLLATDIAILFAQKGKGTITDADFAAEARSLQQQMAAWERDIDPRMKDPAKLVTDFSGAPPRDPDDIVDPYAGDFLFGGDLFTTNFALQDYWAVDLMFKSQLAAARGNLADPELRDIAFKLCHMFEAIELYPHSPVGSVVAVQAGLGMACLFLPKDQKHTMWARRKLATVESKGYIYPASFRQRMAPLWGDSVLHWWLPDDDAYPPVIRQIRAFIEFRAREPRSRVDRDLRSMRGVFQGLSVAADAEDEG